MLGVSAKKKAEILIIWSGFVGRHFVAIPLTFCFVVSIVVESERVRMWCNSGI